MDKVKINVLVKGKVGPILWTVDLDAVFCIVSSMVPKVLSYLNVLHSMMDFVALNKLRWCARTTTSFLRVTN